MVFKIAGATNFHQESQIVFPNQQQLMTDVQPNQQTLASAPMNCTNPPNVVPPQYNQINLEKPM